MTATTAARRRGANWNWQRDRADLPTPKAPALPEVAPDVRTAARGAILAAFPGAILTDTPAGIRVRLKAATGAPWGLLNLVGAAPRWTMGLTVSRKGSLDEIAAALIDALRRAENVTAAIEAPINLPRKG